jgi:hypothetical protein
VRWPFRDNGDARRERPPSSSSTPGSSGRVVVFVFPRTGGRTAGGSSFEDAFEAELVADLGDLGPGAAEAANDRGGGGGDRRPSRGRSRRR